ncbi:type I restriction enzyme endonuclease domain-containing protein [Flexivirga lutea]
MPGRRLRPTVYHRLDQSLQPLVSKTFAQIAPDLVAVMRRDTRTDWTVRDDVKAKVRSSIKRLLVRNGYPPDEQPRAIKLVIEQMEAMAPTFAEERKQSA